MKYIKLLMFCLVLASCSTIIRYKKIKNFTKKIDIENDCKQKSYSWKKDHSLLDGIYKIKVGRGVILFKHYSQGIERISTTFYKKEEIDNTIYKNYGNYCTTVYDEKSMYFILSDISNSFLFDSISYCYENWFLQEIKFYKEEQEFETTLKYLPGKIEVKSVTDDFFYNDLIYASMDARCPYEILMIDPKTGNLFEQIEIEIKKPSGVYLDYYILEENRYILR